MQTNKEAEQVTLSDLGICCGKMFQEPSPAELPKARTSVSSSKRSSELSAVPFMSLDLTPGHGNLLGESYWELISPWLGGAWMLNYAKLHIIERRYPVWSSLWGGSPQPFGRYSYLGGFASVSHSFFVEFGE